MLFNQRSDEERRKFFEQNSWKLDQALKASEASSKTSSPKPEPTEEKTHVEEITAEVEQPLIPAADFVDTANLDPADDVEDPAYVEANTADADAGFELDDSAEISFEETATEEPAAEEAGFELDDSAEISFEETATEEPAAEEAGFELDDSAEISFEEEPATEAPAAEDDGFDFGNDEVNLDDLEF